MKKQSINLTALEIQTIKNCLEDALEDKSRYHSRYSDFAFPIIEKLIEDVDCCLDAFACGEV